MDNILLFIALLSPIALLAGIAIGLVLGAFFKEEVMEAIYIITGRGY